MKRQFIAALLFLILLPAASAQLFTPIPVPQFLSGPVTPITISFVSSATEATGTSPHTYAAQAIGTASSSRIVIVGVSIRGTSVTTSSVTIGGISASKIIEKVGTSMQGSIWAANVPTGATADIIVTSAANTRTAIIVWAMTGTHGLTAAANTASVENGGLSSISTTLTIPGNGGAVGLANIDVAGTVTSTWTGLTKDVDVAMSGANTAAGAHLTPSTTQTGLTISDTWSATTGADDATLVAASWSP